MLIFMRENIVSVCNRLAPGVTNPWSESLKSSSRFKCRSSPYPSPVSASDPCDLVDPSTSGSLIPYPHLGNQIPHTGTTPPIYASTPPDPRLCYAHPYEAYDERYIRPEVVNGVPYNICPQLPPAQVTDSTCIQSYSKAALYDDRPWSQGSGSSTTSEDPRQEYITLNSTPQHINSNTNPPPSHPPSHPSQHNATQSFALYSTQEYYFSDKIHYPEKLTHYSDKIQYTSTHANTYTSQEKCTSSQSSYTHPIPDILPTTSAAVEEGGASTERQPVETTPEHCTRIPDIECEQQQPQPPNTGNVVACSRQIYHYIENEIQPKPNQPVQQPVYTSVIKDTHHYHSQNEYVH
ncbi:hypothetical protein Avbf_14543 [Armadillidium vulgare]|nr:hypothetical protein Avbf_14543 [Armadillidium vulgare]